MGKIFLCLFIITILSIKPNHCEDEDAEDSKTKNSPQSADKPSATISKVVSNVVDDIKSKISPAKSKERHKIVGAVKNFVKDLLKAKIEIIEKIPELF